MCLSVHVSLSHFVPASPSGLSHINGNPHYTAVYTECYANFEVLVSILLSVSVKMDVHTQKDQNLRYMLFMFYRENIQQKPKH